MGLAAVVVGLPHLETGPSAEEEEGDVGVGVGAALPELVGPHDGGVVEHGALRPGLGNLVELPGEVGNFPGEPLVDAQELVLGFLVLDRLVGKLVMALFNVQPAHAGPTHRPHVLQGAHAAHVIGEGVDEEVDLHAADLWSVVVDQFDVGIEFRLGVNQFVRFPVPGEFTLHGTDELEVVPEALPVFRTDLRGYLAEVFADIVEEPREGGLVLALPVELVEHLVGIVDRGDRFVGPGVNHPGPVVGPVGHRDPELEGTETRAGGRIVLQEIPDLLIDGDAIGPSGGVMGAALDVPGKEFNPGEEAADPALVLVAVTPDPVVQPLEHEHAVLEPGEGFENGLEVAEGAGLVLPEVRREGAIRREHDDETLPAGNRVGGL